ncbi:hypothetical protein K501DRAFT_336804, partial [Backusella circina FSU 941]
MIETLSNELLIDIFQRLPKQSQKACISVCQSWYTAAMISYYNQVIVKSYEELLALHLLLLTSTTDLGSLIHYFAWKKSSCSNSRFFSLIEFEDLIDLCPNVRALEVCEPYRIYLEQSTKLKSRKFQRIRFNTEFTGTLTVVPYNTLLVFQSSIAHQEIYTDHFFQQNIFKNIPEYLRKFNRLKTLVIRGGSVGDVIQLSTFIPTLPYLVNLVIETQDTWLLNTEYVTVASSGVQFLKMKLAVASGNFLLYLMKTFPHLTSLCLDFEENSDLNDVDMGVLDSFMEYIRMIPSVEITFSDFSCKVLDKKIATSLTNSAIRLSITTEAIARWKKAVSNKWSYSDRRVNWKNADQINSNPLIITDLKFNSHQMVSSGKQKYSTCGYNYVCSNRYFETSHELPFLDLLQSLRLMLNSVTIDLHPTPLSTIDLDSILTRLPLLEVLVIRKNKSNFHNYVTVSAPKVPHKSLKSLTLKGMKIDQLFNSILSAHCIQLEHIDLKGCLFHIP